MRILLITTPIRPVPTNYPPFGSLAIIQSLRAIGHDPFFLDIDGLRPTFSEAIARIVRYSPDILLISAVVSTAYAYVERLTQAIRAKLPLTRIILGGNLAASAELLHQFGVDICVIGEGERTIQSLIKLNRYSDIELSRIRGITFIDSSGRFQFTGYSNAIPTSEFLDPDFSILEEHSNISNYITNPFDRLDFAQDPRSYQPHRLDKMLAIVVSSKGCVARCTFCHRWDKGFRQIDPEVIIQRIKYLMENYNVGFIQFGDENFGSDRKALDKLLELLKPLDILWQVAGVRARTVDADLLKRMKSAGCVAVYYGFETGSTQMLKVMEKNLDLSHNLNAALWTREAGLYTCYQLVLAMPGETPDTICETIQMTNTLTEHCPEIPTERLSVNYIQALPGTPVYEYARSQHLITSESDYLRQISDTDAYDDQKFINFTDYPYLVVRSWRLWLLYEAVVHWYRHTRIGVSTPRLSNPDTGYFNLHKLFISPKLLSMLYPLKWPIIYLRVLYTEYRYSGLKILIGRIMELVEWLGNRHQTLSDYRSLRAIMKSKGTAEPLREGR